MVMGNDEDGDHLLVHQQPSRLSQHLSWQLLLYLWQWQPPISLLMQKQVRALGGDTLCRGQTFRNIRLLDNLLGNFNRLPLYRFQLSYGSITIRVK